MADYEIWTVPTRILTHKDNIVDAIEQYAKGRVGPDDVVCVAESVVAITQNRALLPTDLKPSFLAKIMCRFVPQTGSLASIYGMQAAMDLEGKWRLFFAMIVGFLAKIVGVSGVFYKLAGFQASLIDDMTGTMPPYDKHVVLGPDKPSEVAEAIKQRMGCFGAAVTDVNDLKRAAILGWTTGIDTERLAHMVIDNPFGNASQKTPIVIVKNYRQAAQQTAV